MTRYNMKEKRKKERKINKNKQRKKGKQNNNNNKKNLKVNRATGINQHGYVRKLVRY